MKKFIKNNRNRADLYHVAVPLTLALLMAPQSLAGSAVFLLVWGLIRWSGHG